jgi:hypothetical protein
METSEIKPMNNLNNDIKGIDIYYKPGKLLFDGCLSFYTKRLARKILNIKRGPDVVLDSLVRGLKLKNIDFRINPRRPSSDRLCHVIWNDKALLWALDKKEKGLITRLIVGPNLSILPSDYNGIMGHKEVDCILLPSEWTSDAFKIDMPKIASKIRVWPSGVEIPPTSSISPIRSKEMILIYKKDYPEDNLNIITMYLKSRNINHKVIRYGQFRQKDYFAYLKKSIAMIYLQKSESQGIALQEAWARDVPTLVNKTNSYIYRHNNKNIEVDGQISAPYLTDEAGMFFNDVDNFSTDFNLFIKNIDKYKPRKYCIENLSDQSSISKYLDIIEDIPVGTLLPSSPDKINDLK